MEMERDEQRGAATRAAQHEGAGIPRRILQTGKRLPEALRLRAMVRNMRLLHPDYEYLFFDNAGVEQFIDREFPEYRAVFDGFPYPIQRYDFFRYLAVYRLGGFYFDLDILLAEDLSSLLERSCVFPFERLTLSRFLREERGMDWEIGNYAFGAAAGHPFLKAVIENCVRAQKDPEWVRPMLRGVPRLVRDAYVVLYSTGPGMVSRTLAENPEIGRTVTVLFPEDVCDEGSWNLFGELGVHMMDGAWRAGKGPVRGRLERLLVERRRARLIEESRLLGRTRQHPVVR
jgi:hypothetical protein